MKARPGFYIALWLAVLVGVAAAADASAQERRRMHTEVIALAYDHRSNLFDGFPFHRNVDGHEPTEDSVMSGVTLVWPKIELDLLHGVSARDCNLIGGGKRQCNTEQGSRVSLRWYPWRR